MSQSCNNVIETIGFNSKPTKTKGTGAAKNAPVKKARVEKMKELAVMFHSGINNNDNSSNFFNKFYVTKKLIYPWLTKESLRWHIRVKKQHKSDTVTTNSTVLGRQNKTSTLESVSTDQDREIRSHDL